MPPRTSEAAAPRRRTLPLAALVYGVALLCAFGGYLGSGYPNDDGHAYLLEFRSWELDAVTGGFDAAAHGPWERLLATGRGEILRAHYVPTTTVFWHALYMIFGEDHWCHAVIATGLLIHWLAALMLLALLGRLGLSTPLAFVAGLVYLLHPVSGIGLSCSNGVIRMYGVALVFGAMLLWDRNLPGRPLRPGLLVLANLLFFLSLHANPTFFASSPLLVFWFAGLQWLGSKQAFWPWARGMLARGSTFLVTFGLAVWMRLRYQGQMGTTHAFANERIDAKTKTFLDGLWENFVLLVPPAEVADHPDEGIPLPEGAGPDATAWILAGIGFAVAVLGTWWAFRRRATAAPLLRGLPLLRTALFLAGLVAFLPLVYHVVRGDVYLHRYLYVGIPAAGVAAALLLALLLALPVRLARAGGTAALAALLLAGVLPFFVTRNAESVASVNWAKQAEEVAALAAAEVLATEPGVVQVYFLNLPRTAGRAGMLFKRDDAILAGVRRELWRQHGIVVPWSTAQQNGGAAYHGETLAEHWPLLGASEAVRKATAVLHFDRRTMAVSRIHRVENHGALAAPFALEFPVGAAARSGRATGLRTDLRPEPMEAVIAGPRVTTIQTIAALERALVDKPDYLLKRLDGAVARYGRRMEPLLLSMLEAPAPSLRRLAAEQLTGLWSLDDARTRTLLASAHTAYAQAVVRILDERDDDAARDLLLLAKERRETRALAVLALAARTPGDDAAFALLESEGIDGKALAVASFVVGGLPQSERLAGALLLDERLARSTRDRLREVLLRSDADEGLAPLVTSFAAHPPRALDLWALPEQLPRSASAKALGILGRALALPDLRGAVRTRLEEAWSRIAPEVPVALAGLGFAPLGEAAAPALAAGMTPAHHALLPELGWIAVQERVIAEPVDAPDEAVLGPMPAARRGPLPLEAQLRAWRTPGDPAPRLTVKVDVPVPFPEPAEDPAYGALLLLANEAGGAPLTGGAGPLACRITLAWRSVIEGHAPVVATARAVEIPGHLLAGGEQVAIPVRLLAPARPGVYDLTARVTRRFRDGSEQVLEETGGKASLGRIATHVLLTGR